MELTDKLIDEFQNYKLNLKKKGIDEVFNNSYYTSLMFELEYVLFKPFEDDDEEEFNKSFGSLKNLKGNICEQIIDYFEELRHRERYNFFDPECLKGIILSFISDNKLGGK